MVTTCRNDGVSKANKMDTPSPAPKETKVPGTLTLKLNAAHKKTRKSGTSKSKLNPAPKSPVVERRSQISDAPGLGTHVLFLFIGEPRELITIHSNLLPNATKTFINERNVDGQIYQLPDEDVTIFEIYRLFLYTGKVYSEHDGDQDTPDDGRRAVHEDDEWSRLANCYFFGCAVRDERFANASIDAIIEKMTISDRYPTGIAGEVYSSTAAGDNFRELLVDVHVWKGRGTWVKPPHDDAHAPVQFLQDVIASLATAGANVYDDEVEMPWEEAPCAYYHMHDATALCRR